MINIKSYRVAQFTQHGGSTYSLRGEKTFLY